jgi:cellulose synthase operon protein B
MKKRLVQISLLWATCLAIAAALVAPVSALDFTPQFVPRTVDVPHAADGTDTITLADLQQGEIQLTGPYDSQSLRFGLPANWKLLPGATLNLFLTTSFINQGAGTDASINGGVLTVRFNSVTIAVIPLTQTGDLQQLIPIPEQALQSTRSDGRMELGFFLDSGLSCTVNQHMQVIIHPSTTFTFPHVIVPPDLSLLNFPRPLYQQSIVPDSALIVVPDQPTASELQSALTLSASLTNLTNGGLGLQLVTASEVTGDQLATNHLILVGNPASLPQLANLSLPLAPSGGSFTLPQADDGVVMMATSPWNPARVALVVSGNSDAGVLKASQAVSTGILRPNTAENLAIVERVQEQPLQSETADLTLAEMGYPRDTLSGLGVKSAVYDFYVPAGQTLTTEAYFDLYFAHSGLLDYSRSGISVLLNGQPITSIPLNDNSAKQTVNIQRVAIPASAVVTGLNRLEVSANLIPINECSAFNGSLSTGQWSALWATIWPESRFHLPLQPTPVSPASVMALNSFPAPFVYDPSLGTTAFVLQRNNPDSWRMASQIAGYLGNRANGVLTTLKAFYADEIPAEARGQYNLLTIGQPSRLPVISEIKDRLPIPFSSETNLPIETGMQVIFRIPNNASLGYIELLTSPWNEQNVLLTVLGSTSQGLQWASSALTDPSLRGQLSGNFSAITDRQVVSTDTRLTGLSDFPDIVPGSTSLPQATPAALIDVSATNQHKPTWPLAATIVAAGLALLVLAYVVIRNMRK